MYPFPLAAGVANVQREIIIDRDDSRQAADRDIIGVIVSFF
ncbi:MAG: hypothetical protein ACI8RD_013484 [Bacillariaceae sp.]|jgi:hypothetical protein